MVRRKADRARVVGDVVEAKRLRVVDQGAEEPAAVRRVADELLSLLVDPGDHELLQSKAALIDHPERRVRRSGQLGRGLHDLLENRVEGEL